MNEFIITISEEESLNIERINYELDRECQNVARLISKNIPFAGSAVKKRYDAFVEKVISYDDAKDKLSTTAVIPVVVEKWGDNAIVTWLLNYHTKNITVKFDKKDTRTKHDGVIDIDAELCERMKFLSVNTKACEELDDYLISTYPNLDNSAYKEFLQYKESLDTEYMEKKKIVENDYVRPWLVSEIGENYGDFEWHLVFKDNKITVYTE